MMQKSSGAHMSKGRAASVSPIVDEEVIDMDEQVLQFSDEDDEEREEIYEPNNHFVNSFVMNRVPDDDIYKRKLSAPHVPPLPQILNLANDSNQQDLEAQLQLPLSSLTSSKKKTTSTSSKSSNSSLSSRGGLFHSEDSSSSSKYAVNVGQKQQWRKSRSQQPRHSQRISYIPSLEDDEQPESARSQVSTSRTSEQELSTGRTSSSHSYSLVSPRIVSSTLELTSPRPGMSPRSTLKEPAFVITEQKKSKYTAKILLPGQKPIYLGRFNSENTAQAACEQAFGRIMTPRNE